MIGLIKQILSVVPSKKKVAIFVSKVAIHNAAVSS